MVVELPDGRIRLTGIDLEEYTNWKEKEGEKERMKWGRVPKGRNRPRVKGQIFHRVCENDNNHIITVPAREIDESYCFCGGRLKLQ